jgi:6-pyruvoyltetrahydropterin/6-carboxytetrahydropterin synthase
MYTIERSFSFAAGHCLTNGVGMCSRLHGHTFTLRIILQAETLHTSGPQKNMIMDLEQLHALTKPMLDTYFEHRWLNETLETDAPTLEFCARWIYNYLHPQLPHLHRIELTEDGTCTASYQE